MRAILRVFGVGVAVGAAALSGALFVGAYLR